MKILILYREKSACDYHRITLPFTYLPLENGEHVTYMTDEDVYQTRFFKEVDLVIFNRHPTVDMTQFKEMKVRYGFKVWCDIDDSWDLPEDHYLYNIWKTHKISNLIIESLNVADVVTVTNKRLLRKASSINKRCQIVPNGLPFGHQQFSPDKTDSIKLRFLYAGGPSHEKDLESIEEYLKLTTFNTHVVKKTQFILAGFRNDYKEGSLHEMNRIMRVTPGYKTREALPLNRYMEHYNYADVALAPLEKNDFNTYKSNLKIIEAGCMKTPIIVSSMYPFLEDLEMENKGVYFCQTASDWMNYTRSLMDNSNLVIEDGEKLHEYVKEKYDLLKINIIRRQILNSFK